MTQPDSPPPASPLTSGKPLFHFARGSVARSVVWGICGVALLLGFVYIVVVPSCPPAPIRSKVARVKSDHRAIAMALEAYFSEYQAYPAHTADPAWVSNPDVALGATDRTPTFRTRHATQLATLTTPFAFLPKYPPDIFASNDRTFCYYTQDAGWILWSPGPDADYDLDPHRDYDPSILQPSSQLLSGPSYDSTNGTISNGDVWRVKE